MTAGLEIRNASNVFQIDGVRPNFLLRQKGSGTCSTSQTSGGKTRYYTQIVVTNCVSPMIAIGGNSTRCCVYFISVSGSTWTFTIMSPTNGATFDYWVFDQGVSVSGNAGLEVYSAGGALVYKSGGKPLRIVGTGGGTYASGRTYACIQTTNGWSFSQFDFDFDGLIDSYSSYFGAFTVASNVITDLPFIYESYSGFAGVDDSYTDPNYQLLVVDVTNL